MPEAFNSPLGLVVRLSTFGDGMTFSRDFPWASPWYLGASGSIPSPITIKKPQEDSDFFFPHTNLDLILSMYIS